MTGLSYATRGDCEAGIKECERARELAPDPFETAAVLACLGKAYAEAGDLSRAIPSLEQGVKLAEKVRSLQWREWFRALLAEAYFLNGQMDKGGETARQALGVCAQVGYSWGIGWSHQVLGRVGHALGAFAEAEQHLGDSLQVFGSVKAPFETGRTRLFLASLALAQDKREAAATHLSEARSLFAALRVPKYVERVESLARSMSAGG